MNCIFCHQPADCTSAGKHIDKYYCSDCQASFDTFIGIIMSLTITYDLNNKKYIAHIHPHPSIHGEWPCIYISISNSYISTIPLAWMFPHMVPPIIQRLDNLLPFN